MSKRLSPTKAGFLFPESVVEEAAFLEGALALPTGRQFSHTNTHDLLKILRALGTGKAADLHRPPVSSGLDPRWETDFKRKIGEADAK